MIKSALMGLAVMAAWGASAPVSALALQEPAPSSVSAERAALLEKACVIGIAMGVERRTGEMLQQLTGTSGSAMIAELEATEEGRELLAAIDRDFAGGRDGFAQTFSQELASRFTASLPLYAEKGAELIVDTVSSADLDAWHDAVIGPDGAPRTGEDAVRARDALFRSGAMQRIAATQSIVIEGLQTFGQALGERLGVESFEAIANRHPHIFGNGE